jgi:hypothetical protein
MACGVLIYDRADVAREQIMTKALKIGIAVTVILMLGAAAACYATPYIALSRFRAAVQARDSETISSYVDYASLRESLKGSISGKLAPPAEQTNQGLASLQAIAGTFANRLIDTVVTPETVARMMEGERPVGIPNAPSSVSAAPPVVDMGYEDPATFVVSVRKPIDTNALNLVFTRDGLSWKLSSVRLPP